MLEVLRAIAIIDLIADKVVGKYFMRTQILKDNSIG